MSATSHLVRQHLRTGYYAALHRMMHRAGGEAARASASSGGPMPSERRLLGDVLALARRDARNVARGIYPTPTAEFTSPVAHLRTVASMFADLPKSAERRIAANGREAATLPEAAGLPDYYTQNFHYQTGGYLTADSAALYDLQVETLFLGSAAAMRRQALVPIAEFVRGRNQRRLHLVDVACGTGRFLAQLKAAYPAMPMTGIDLSAAYIAEARAHLGQRRALTLREGNAEALPLADASADIVTCVFLFHELPRAVRRNALAEFRRVLKPGGLLIFVDSAQTGDVPGYDGLLASFPARFHEPYYLDYLGDEAAAAIAAAGFLPTVTDIAFLSKIVAARKPAG